MTKKHTNTNVIIAIIAIMNNISYLWMYVQQLIFSRSVSFFCSLAGWVYNEENPRGDNYIDFGIFDVNKEPARDFVNGYEKSILLDFNVDGPIIDNFEVYAE